MVRYFRTYLCFTHNHLRSVWLLGTLVPSAHIGILWKDTFVFGSIIISFLNLIISVITFRFVSGVRYKVWFRISLGPVQILLIIILTDTTFCTLYSLSGLIFFEVIWWGLLRLLLSDTTGLIFLWVTLSKEEL